MINNKIILDKTMNSQTLVLPFDARVLGTVANETIKVLQGADVHFVAGANDRLEVAGKAEDYTYYAQGNNLYFNHLETGSQLAVSIGGDVQIVFADGAALTYFDLETLQVMLGGIPVDGEVFDTQLMALNSADVSSIGQANLDDLIGTGNTQALTLTEGPDTLTGTQAGDIFAASENTLSSSDTLDGGQGIDTLRYASSGTQLITESGFTFKNIERLNITADATLGTRFDVTGVENLEVLTNINSSQHLILEGLTSLLGLTLEDVSGGDTLVLYKDEVLTGNQDTQALVFNGNKANDESAVSAIYIGDTSSNGTSGLEALQITTKGDASSLTSLVTGANSLQIQGTQDLSILNTLFNATEIDASTFTGDLAIKVDSSTKGIKVIGGSGDDTVDFSNGWGPDDTFDGGAGEDALGLTYQVATGVNADNGGLVENVEYLNIKDLIQNNNILDISSFPGIQGILLSGGIDWGFMPEIHYIQEDITLDWDFSNTANAGSLSLVADPAKNDLHIHINLTHLLAGETLSQLKTEGIAEVTLNLQDQTSTDEGSIQLSSLDLGEAEAIYFTGDADIRVLNVVNPLTPSLKKLDASGLQGKLSLNNIHTAATGADIKLGASDDIWVLGTAMGADTFTLGAGRDTLVYSHVSQSNTNMDTITDFNVGEDIIDIRNLLGATPNTNQFAGNQTSFSLTQGALAGNGIRNVVFQQDEHLLWVDVDGNGTLDNNDFRIRLEGVTGITAADLGFTPGVNFTAKQSGFNTNVPSHSLENKATGNEDDTINTSIAYLPNAIINGQGGEDTLKISGTPSASESANLTEPLVYLSNVEKIHLEASVEDLQLDANDLGLNGITSIQGAFDANQSLTLHQGGDLSNTHIQGIEKLVQTGSTLMKVEQHQGFASIEASGSSDSISLTDAGTLVGNASIENYYLGGTGNNHFTLGTGTQNVIASNWGAVHHININSLSVNANLLGFDSADTLIAENGASLVNANGGNALGFGRLELSGGLSLTASQASADFLSSIQASGNNDTFNLVNGTGFTNFITHAAIENYIFGDDLEDNGFNVIINGANQNIVSQDSNDFGDSVTFSFGAGALNFSGSILGESSLGSTDTLSLANNANIQAASISGISHLALDANASVYLSMNQYNGFTGNHIASGVETLYLSGNTGTNLSASAVIENYVLQGSGDDHFTISQQANPALTDNIRAQISLDLAGGGKDRITLDNSVVNAGVDSSVEIANFSADDIISTAVNGTSTSNGILYNDYNGVAAVALSTGDKLEIDATAFQYSVATNTANLLTWLNAHNVTGSANAQTTVVAYNGQDTAAIYQVAETSGIAGQFDSVELIAIMQNITDNSLAGANFA